MAHVIKITGKAGSGKTETLNYLYEAFSVSDCRTLFIEGDGTFAGIVQAIQEQSGEVAIMIDECSERILSNLEDKFRDNTDLRIYAAMSGEA